MLGKRISSETRAQIKILYEEGHSKRQIARKLQVAQRRVSRSIFNFKKSGKYGFKKPTGRSKITNKRMDDSIILVAKKITQKVIQSHPGWTTKIYCSTQPKKNSRLFNANLKSFRPAKKPKLSVKNIADRLAFCQKYQGWSAGQWRSVMFSDETLASQFYAFCRHVGRPLKQRDNPRYIVPTVKNASKVMIWAAICAGGRSGLRFMPEGTSINGTVYLEVLKSKVLSFMEIKRCSHFQHDGAPVPSDKSSEEMAWWSWDWDPGQEILQISIP